MELLISAVTGELVSRFISFLVNKYQSSLSHAQSEEEKVVLERLQHLLMRAGTIVEEADTRYITNSRMMVQLKTLSEAMYRGYCMLDTSRYRALQDGAGFDEVREQYGMGLNCFQQAQVCGLTYPSPAGAPSRSRTAAAQVAGQGRRRQPLRATSMLSHRAAASPPLVGWLSTSSSAPHGRWKQIRLEIWKEEKSCSFHDLVGEGKAGGGGSGEGGRPEKSAEGGNSFFFRGIGKVLRARYRWVGARREGLGSPVGP
ncbi:hypothetical protein BRADI_5g01090v3 [Brachypodium distachyon]|uniref:Rx N-terminal domain-containing protein n=1 Tax=Brachypodium distachyon TaxID=15368 RepID=I1IVL1_BRADI|nr:hypothetical protein BRADI_5g01090v3 [Brachypodium distachyon]